MFLIAPLAACNGVGATPAPAGAPAGADTDGEATAVNAQSIDVVELAGIDEALRAERGHGVLVNFWAMWCPPCVAKLPDLNAVANAYRDEGGAVLAVSFDLLTTGGEKATFGSKVGEFLGRREPDLRVLVYDAPDYEAINDRFDLPGFIPVTLAYDKDGVLVDRHEGEGTRRASTR